MSDLLQLTYQGSAATLYAIIRRRSDQYAFNGTAFEAWSDANLSDYAVALQDAGGDLYTLTIPSSVAAGDYTAIYYEQAGDDPASDDLLLARRDFHWNGQTASSGSSVELSSYALTSLDSVKNYLDITTGDYDTLLTTLINSVSSQIERIVGRRYKARNYRFWLNSNDQTRLTLPVYPIQYITRIAWGVANAFTVTFSGSAIRADVSLYRDPESPDAGGFRLVSVASSGVPTATDLLFADYPSVSTLVDAINNLSGWSASVLINVPSADLHATGGESALGRGVILTYPDQDESAYSVDYSSGQVEFSDRSGWWLRNLTQGRFPRGHQSILIECRAGYETIPSDVDLVCRDLVKEFYSLRKQDTFLINFKTGPYAAQFRDSHEQYVRDRLGGLTDAASLIGGSE